MKPLQRCDAEIATALSTEGHPAWMIAIWHLDWEVERWLLQRESGL